MKIFNVIFSLHAKEVYARLDELSFSSKIEQSIFKAINKKLEFVKLDPHYSNGISKKLIPKEYKTKYNLTNLFRIELPSYWRLLYTLNSDDKEITIFVLDILDHKEYNKLFGYKNK